MLSNGAQVFGSTSPPGLSSKPSTSKPLQFAGSDANGVIGSENMPLGAGMVPGSGVGVVPGSGVGVRLGSMPVPGAGPGIAGGFNPADAPAMPPGGGSVCGSVMPS